MLNLQHVYKSFNDTSVLDDVSLAVNPGEVVALIGKNGAGKTTLLRILLGELTADSGGVNLHNEVTGYVPQSPKLGSTIEQTFENCESWRIQYALDLVSLGEKPLGTVVKRLSGGQRTRLAIAKVLASDPEPTMLLLDEPTNNLDAKGQDWLAGFIKQFRGGAILVSHDRAFINQVATKVVDLRKGKLYPIRRQLRWLQGSAPGRGRDRMARI